jgi:acyl-CoA synthetase (NDP forming)
MSGNLRFLLRPRSIAILGASEDLRKLNGRPLKFLLEKKYAGRIFPVNPKYHAISGLRCYPSVAAIPDSVDLAIIAVPAAFVAASVRELGAKGVPAAVIFSSGFAEMGADGKRLEDELRALARASGVRLCGPNCLGLINAYDQVIATFGQYADGPTPAGPVGFVTQSGAFGTAIAALARRRGLGLGYFVNTGNEADIEFAEVMQEVLADPRIRVGAGYLEGIKDGDALTQVARQALSTRKPLVLAKVGRTSAGARAAASHTGSLAGEDLVFDGVARQFGVVRARNEEHMLDLVEAFAHCSLPQGSGIGIITQSGGAGVLMADRAEELGLQVPLLGAETREKLQGIVPGFGALANPVDITGQFVAEPTLLENSVAFMLDDPNVHIGIVWLQLMDAYVDLLVTIFGRIKATAQKPIIVCWVAAPERALQELHALGIAVLRGAEPAVDAAAGLIQYAQARRDWERDQEDPRALSGTIPALPDATGPVPCVQAASILAAHGLPVLNTLLATSAEEAVRHAAALGYPVALKIESIDILHKTDAHGVMLGLDSADAVRSAFVQVIDRAREMRPSARIAGVTIQPMAPAGVELVIGLKRDAVFGTVVMVGLGGIMIEVLRDVVVRKAPVSARHAMVMLDALRGRALLDGVRGKTAVDRPALAALISAVSRFGVALGPRLRELDLNPVIGSGRSLHAVDWLLVLD